MLSSERKVYAVFMVLERTCHSTLGNNVACVDLYRVGGKLLDGKHFTEMTLHVLK